MLSPYMSIKIENIMVEVQAFNRSHSRHKTVRVMTLITNDILTHKPMLAWQVLNS